MRQLSPIVDFLGLYKRELTSFFANTPPRRRPGRTTSGVHYLRTTNPLNPENLAVYPRRIGSNRPTPTPSRGQFTQLAPGMPVFDNRGCGTGLPQHHQRAAVPRRRPRRSWSRPTCCNQIIKFVFGGTPGNVPPRPAAARSRFGGVITQYPHVGERRAARQVRRRVVRTGGETAGGAPVPSSMGCRAAFERIVRASARRPARRAGGRRRAGGGRRRAGAAAGAERGHGHARRPRRRQLPGDRDLPRAVRRPLGDRARARRPAAPRADLQPRAADRARGLPVGQQAGGAGGARRRAARRATGWRRPSRCRSSTARAPSSTRPAGEINDQIQVQMRTKAAEADAGGARRAAGRARPGQAARPSRSGSASRRASSCTRSSSATCCRSTCATGSGSRSCRASTTPTSSPRWCSTRRAAARDAEGALRLPVPVVAVGADPGAPASPSLTDEQRERGGRARARGGADAGVAAARRRRGYTVTGAPVVADDLTDALTGSTLRLLVAGARADGARARARVPQPRCGCCRWRSRWPPWRSPSGRPRCSARR